MTSQTPGENPKSWYCVIAIYQYAIVETDEKFDSERMVFLVSATNNAEAMERGLILAKDKEHQYKVQNGNTLSVEFVDIEEIKELLDSELKEGSEVYWEFF